MSQNSVGQVQLDLGLDYKSFNSQLKGISSNAQSMVGSSFKKLGGIIAGAFAVKKLFDFSRASLRLASDLEEVQNVVDVTFGSMSKEIDQFAKDALYSFGLSELSAKKFASTMGAMLKSSGLAGEQMKQMSTDLTELAADMASFYNLEHEEAFNKIRSGISGETEPLKQLGINMSVVNLEAFAMSQGINKSYEAMTQAEKTLLRYNYLLSVTKDAQGDFARTSDSWANQVKLMSEQWKIFQSTMGQGFINLLTPVLKMLNSLIQKLQVAAQYFKAFTEVIFGHSEASKATSAAASGMSSAMSDVGKDVKKASKDIKGSLAGFDEINTLAEEASENMESMVPEVPGMDLGGSIEGQNIELGIEINADDEKLVTMKNLLSGIKSIASEIGSYFKITFGPSIAQAIKTISPVLSEWKLEFKNTFNEVMKLGEPLKQWISTDLVPFWQMEIEAMGKVLGGLLDTALKVFNGIKEVALPIFEWFVVEGLPLLTDFSIGVTEIFLGIFDTAKYIFDTLWERAIQPGLKLASSMILDVLNIIKGFWDEWGEDIVDCVVGTIEGIKGLFATLWSNVLGPIINKMLDTWKWLWEKHFKGLIEEVINFVGKLVTAALDIFNKFILPIVNWLIQKLGPAFVEAYTFITDTSSTFLGAILDVVKGLIKAFGGVIDFIAGVFTGDWKRAWNGIKNIFKGIVESLSGVFKGVINALIDIVNMFIRYWNKIELKVPEINLPFGMGTVGGFTVSVPKINQIPKLARGGIIDQPTLAMVGERGKEAVIPFENSGFLEALTGSIVNALMQVMSFLQGGKNNESIIEDKEIILEIDGVQIGRILLPKLDNEAQRLGYKTILRTV